MVGCLGHQPVAVLRHSELELVKVGIAHRILRREIDTVEISLPEEHIHVAPLAKQRIAVRQVGDAWQFVTPEFEQIGKPVGAFEIVPRKPPERRVIAVVQDIMKGDEIADFLIQVGCQPIEVFL